VKKALIVGISGQDGSYLAELLLSKGYEVHGTIRRSSVHNTVNLDPFIEDIQLHFADLADGQSLTNAVELAQPDEVYNLAAQSQVRISFDVPEYTCDVNALGTLRLLTACRDRELRYYQASTSEMFGSAPAPQSEQTPFFPRSPYGISKLFGYWMTKNHREEYKMHASNGILFNHESARRGENFVTQKIVKAAVECNFGTRDVLHLGNLDAQRDWGWAPEYVEAMYMMLQQPKPDDYVIATGETHTVREFCQAVFEYLDLDYKDFVVIDDDLYRPTEVDVLLGDAGKAKKILGWEPRVKFKELVEIMVEAELTGEIHGDPDAE
jgi:GDPmannose 4,6-dehydratase